LQTIHKELKEGSDTLIQENRDLIRMLSNVNMGENPLLVENDVEILKNGEAFFPRLLEDLRNAKQHIHLEYYIYENDKIGNEIAEILIQKAKEGVEVRFIYDDFGSRSIRKTIVRKLKA